MSNLSNSLTENQSKRFACSKSYNVDHDNGDDVDDDAVDDDDGDNDDDEVYDDDGDDDDVMFKSYD